MGSVFPFIRLKKVMATAVAATIACCLVFSFSTSVWADESRLRINCTLHSTYEKFFFRLVRELCARNNIEVERGVPPVGRSLINVNQGLDDGDGPRIAGLSAEYPNVIPVPEPFGFFLFGAFTKNKDVKIEGWSDLADLNVAYIHGWKIFDVNVKSAKSITKVDNKELLFRLLGNDRTDVALITKLAGWDAITKMGIKGVVFIEPALEKTPNYLYLNERHRELAPKLAETLRRIKQSGEYDRLYKEMISPHPSG